MFNCPVCGSGNIVDEKSVYTFEYKGEMLSAQRVDSYCDACGSEVIDAKTARENVRNVQHAKSTHDKLLSGDDIYALRKRFGLTQKVAAALFGGGDSAFAKYESGDITHNVSMDRLLRLTLINPEIILDLAEIAEVQLDRKVINSLSMQSIGDLFSHASNKLSFNKIKLPIHHFPAANDNLMRDIYQNVGDSFFEFQRAAH